MAGRGSGQSDAGFDAVSTATTRTVLLPRIAVGIGFIALVAILWLSPVRDQITTENAVHLRDQFSAHWWGPPLFIAVYALCATLLVPASVFVLSSGFIWGGPVGGSYALVGGTLGACLSYALARFLGADILRRFGPRGVRIADQLQGATFRSFLIVRVIPVIPFAILNYGAGVARIRFGVFVLATILGLAPATYVFSWSAGELLNGRVSGEDAFLRVAVICTAIVLVAVIPSMLKRRAARALAADVEAGKS